MREKFLVGILVVALGVLLGRAGWLMVVEGGDYRVRADGNRVEVRKLPAPRGIIKDRNGEALVRNVVGETQDKIAREYVYGEVLAHIIGYVGEVSQEEVQSYESGTRVGKMGMEKWRDERLRGEDGAEIVETGVKGEVVRRLGRREPTPGEEVQLRVDLGLQKKAVEVLAGRVGAVVVTKTDGEILALVTSPSFDPGQVVEFVDREDKPLFDRATAGEYAPGSIFKLVTAVTGLETGKIESDTQIEDTGEIKIGQFRYGNWYFDQYGRKEGLLDVIGAIKRSNDVFFYRVGERVGPELLADWAVRLGLGQKLDLGWAVTADGLIPDPEWKEKFKGEKWFLGNTYHMAIGQGDVLVTPLQINLLTGAVATGRLCRPQIVEVAQGEQNCKDLGISQKTLELVRRGMTAACSTGGTAWPLFGFEPQVACKTGTAQHGGEETKPHAWFTAMAPADKPELAITVLLEAAGEGSYEAAPVARQVLEYWFKERRGASN